LAGKTIGLTTGQAARYCLVSPDTIVQWIKAKNLPAQRTVGGQFRIFVDGLRQFMVRNEMSTELLDAELNWRPYCWEHHRGLEAQTSTSGTSCSECPVYRTKALNCFELRAINVDRCWASRNCEDCEYFRRWGESSNTDAEEGHG
jgi:excisionase family DNA binding protein